MIDLESSIKTELMELIQIIKSQTKDKVKKKKKKDKAKTNKQVAQSHPSQLPQKLYPNNPNKPFELPVPTKYSEAFDKFFEENCPYGLPVQWTSPYLSPNEQRSTLPYIQDGHNNRICDMDDIITMQCVQEKIEKGVFRIYEFEHDSSETTAIPLDCIPSSVKGERYIWTRFMRSYIDLEDGSTKSVSLTPSLYKYKERDILSVTNYLELNINIDTLRNAEG